MHIFIFIGVVIVIVMNTVIVPAIIIAVIVDSSWVYVLVQLEGLSVWGLVLNFSCIASCCQAILDPAASQTL